MESEEEVLPGTPLESRHPSVGQGPGCKIPLQKLGVVLEPVGEAARQRKGAQQVVFMRSINILNSKEKELSAAAVRATGAKLDDVFIYEQAVVAGHKGPVEDIDFLVGLGPATACLIR